MAVRGSTLATLITRVRDVIPGQSTTGSNTDSAATKALNRAREFMYTQYLWPHLRVRVELTLVGGKDPLPSDFFTAATLRDINHTEWTKVDPMTFELGINQGNIWTTEEESAISRTISTAVLASNEVTITTSTAHSYSVGDSITQSGVASATFNTTVTITAVDSTTTYTYDLTAGDESSTGGTATRDKSDKIFVKPTGTTQLFLRYYKTLTDMSAVTDQSEFFPQQEQAMVWGAVEFLGLRDRDFDAISLWEQSFKDRLNPVFQQVVDDDSEDQGFISVFDKKSIFNHHNVRRISS